ADGDDDRAREFVVQAETDLGAFGGWHQILLARWLRADVERSLGNAGDAQRLFETAVQDSISHGQPQITERCFTGLGLVAIAKGETEVAERHFRNAMGVTEELR